MTTEPTKEPTTTRPMSDAAIAWLRTVIPGLWGALVTWVLTLVALPDALTEYLTSNATITVVTAAVIGLWHLIWNKVGPHIPDWLETILMGHTGRAQYALAA